MKNLTNYHTHAHTHTHRRSLVWFDLVLWHINHRRLFNTKSIFVHINRSISNNLISISSLFSSIQPIDRILSITTISGQRGPGRNRNKGVFRIPQRFSISEACPSNFLVSYPVHSFVGVLHLCRDAVCVFCCPSRLGLHERARARTHTHTHRRARPRTWIYSIYWIAQKRCSKQCIKISGWLFSIRQTVHDTIRSLFCVLLSQFLLIVKTHYILE